MRTGVLGGSSRSTVRRVHDGERSLIVKEFKRAGSGWVREVAALSILGRPELVEARAPTVVMADLGDGPSVADALLGDDPVEAASAVTQWARALAGLHHESAGRREQFRAALVEYALDKPVPDTRIGRDLADAAATLDRYCGELGVEVPAGAWERLRGLDPPGPGALTPADACPDNNVRTPEGLVLISSRGWVVTTRWRRWRTGCGWS